MNDGETGVPGPDAPPGEVPPAGNSHRRRRGPAWAIRELQDEREPLAGAALQLIADAFERPDRQPLTELRSEIAEKRLDLLGAMDFHLLAAVTPEGEAVGTVTGIYLGGVNAGFITYLTVAPAWRRRRLAPGLRGALVEIFRADARSAGFDDLDWVLGEVRAGSPWLRRLVGSGGVITFDLTYYHPGMNPENDDRRYILYRQPVGDARAALPGPLVRRILYAIYRRGYRVRYPLERASFQAMMEQLEGREWVGPHPDYAVPPST